MLFPWSKRLKREEATSRKASAGLEVRKGLKSVSSQKDPVIDCERRVSASLMQLAGFQQSKRSLTSELDKFTEFEFDDFRDFRQCPPLIDVALRCRDDVQMLLQPHSGGLERHDWQVS